MKRFIQNKHTNFRLQEQSQHHFQSAYSITENGRPWDFLKESNKPVELDKPTDKSHGFQRRVLRVYDQHTTTTTLCIT